MMFPTHMLTLLKSGNGPSLVEPAATLWAL